MNIEKRYRGIIRILNSKSREMTIFVYLLTCMCLLLVVSIKSSKGSRNIVGFWHIFGNSLDRVKSITIEQLITINESSLIHYLDKIYYNVIGEEISAFQIDHIKFERLNKFPQRSGNEIDTLNAIKDYCLKNSNDFILYFHTKGSFHMSDKNTQFRRVLDCFVLNPNCIFTLEMGYDTCGWRMSPFPFIHYSGNFWWSTCSHINSLVKPLEANILLSNYTQSILQITHSKASRKKSIYKLNSRLGIGRYFSEYWIGSYPHFKPSDCFNVSIDNQYIFGYNIPLEKVYPYCPNINLQDLSTNKSKIKNRMYGLRCKNASILVNPEKMNLSQFGNSLRRLSPYLSKLFLKSQILYNQLPLLQIRWIAKFDQIIENKNFFFSRRAFEIRTSY